MNFINSKKITWIDIENSSQGDIAYLKKNFNFHPLVLSELTPPSHRPRVEDYDEYLFLIFHVPFLDKTKREVHSRELDIIVTKNHLITSRYQNILPLKALFDQCNLYDKARENYMNETTGHLLYYILHSIMDYIAPKLEYIEDGIDHIEERIFKGREKEMVFEISLFKRIIIDFRRIIDPQKSFFDALMKDGVIFFGPRLEPYLSDIVSSHSGILEFLQTNKETIDALEQTNKSLLTTKSNEVMKILTIFASITLPLSLIASIFGMNTSLPFENGVRSDFWFILGLMVLTAIGLLLYFKKRGWI